MSAQHPNKTGRPSKVGADYALPYLCFDCGQPKAKLFHAGSCRACLVGSCLTCGKPTDDDGLDFCPEHTPYCNQCDKPCNELFGELCESCADALPVDMGKPENYLRDSQWIGGKP
jgi:hypothetical protein